MDRIAVRDINGHKLSGRFAPGKEGWRGVVIEKRGGRNVEFCNVV